MEMWSLAEEGLGPDRRRMRGGSNARKRKNPPSPVSPTSSLNRPLMPVFKKYQGLLIPCKNPPPGIVRIHVFFLI